MNRQIDFVTLLSMVQEHISSKYAATLTDTTKLSQLKSYIEKYLRDTAYSVEGMTDEKLCDKIYSEMAEYSILTPFLGRDNVEEININICSFSNSQNPLNTRHKEDKRND